MVVQTLSSCCNTCSPFTPINRDLCFFANILLEAAETQDSQERKSVPTVEPKHFYFADSDGIRLEIELPGVAEKHISIEVNENKLAVTGKRYSKQDSQEARNEGNEKADMDSPKKSQEKQEKEPTLSVVYSFSVRLGCRIDLDAIRAANHGDGVLILTLPFKKAETRHIEISS